MEELVFPGIWLIFRSAARERDTAGFAPPAGCLLIDHCRDGRFEYRSGEQFDYLGPGDLAVHRSGGEDSVFYPTGEYRGLTVAVDLREAPEELGTLLPGAELRPRELMDRFCRGGSRFVMRSTPRLEQIFSALYDAGEGSFPGMRQIKVLELLLFLGTVDPRRDRGENRSCSREQTELAKGVRAYLAAHMDRRCTIEELSRQFHVSATQLKRCFREVYGRSVYSFIRREKMRSAAGELRSTGRTVMEIALAYGYDNASKFAAAFRDEMGITPREYRRARRDGSDWSGKTGEKLV